MSYYLLLQFSTDEQARIAFENMEAQLGVGGLQAAAIHADLDRIIETAKEWDGNWWEKPRG